jgi:Ring finger domain
VKKCMLIVILSCLAVRTSKCDEFDRRMMLRAIEAGDSARIKSIAREFRFDDVDKRLFVQCANKVLQAKKDAVSLFKSKRDLLGAVVGAAGVGLSIAGLVSIYKTLTFVPPKKEDPKADADESEVKEVCGICRDLLKGQPLAKLPCACKLVYHKECIDSWFETNPSCPYCRGNVLESAVRVIDAAQSGQPLEMLLKVPLSVPRQMGLLLGSVVLGCGGAYLLKRSLSCESAKQALNVANANLQYLEQFLTGEAEA